MKTRAFFNKMLVGALAGLAMSATQAHAGSMAAFSQNFESGLTGSESVAGAFAINNTSTLNNGTQMMGHAAAYGNNENSYYQFTVDLKSFTLGVLSFFYNASIEEPDYFTVLASTTGTFNNPADVVTPANNSDMLFSTVYGHVGYDTVNGYLFTDPLRLTGVARFDLSAFDHQAVAFRLQFNSDGSNSDPFAGINFDNVLVYATPSPSALWLVVLGLLLTGRACRFSAAAGRHVQSMAA